MKPKKTILYLLTVVALTASAAPLAHAYPDDPVYWDRWAEAVRKMQQESASKKKAGETTTTASVEKVEADKGSNKGVWDTIVDGFKSLFGISSTSNTK